MNKPYVCHNMENSIMFSSILGADAGTILSGATYKCLVRKY